MNSSETVSTIVAVVAGGFMLALVISLIPALLWLTIDDRLAALVGVQMIGELGFSFAWPFWLILIFLAGTLNRKN